MVTKPRFGILELGSSFSSTPGIMFIPLWLSIQGPIMMVHHM